MPSRTGVASLLLALALLPGLAHACSYPEPPSLRSALQDATAVFVFRLDEAVYKRTELGSVAYTSWVEGRIQPIQTLHGDASRYTRIQFPTFWCGSVNLVVGHHYLIATKASGNTIELVRADGSVLDIEGFYDPRRPERNLSGVLAPVVQAIREGKPLPDDFPSVRMKGRTVVQPPPPPGHGD